MVSSADSENRRLDHFLDAFEPIAVFCFVSLVRRSIKEPGTCILLASRNREDIEVLCDEVYENGCRKASESEVGN